MINDDKVSPSNSTFKDTSHIPLFHWLITCRLLECRCPWLF